MSEEIGLQRCVTFPDPRLEGSAVVKCTEADHYISTTARSDICVLTVSVSIFVTIINCLCVKVVNQGPVPSSSKHHSFDNQVELNVLYLICAFRFPIFLPLVSLLSSHSLTIAFVRGLFWVLCRSTVCLYQFFSAGAVSFLLKCIGRSTKKRSKVWLHFNKEPVCPLWCYAATHFSYKETPLLPLRTKAKDTEPFLTELTTPHHNITITKCTAFFFKLLIMDLFMSAKDMLIFIRW